MRGVLGTGAEPGFLCKGIVLCKGGGAGVHGKE